MADDDALDDDVTSPLLLPSRSALPAISKLPTSQISKEEIKLRLKQKENELLDKYKATTMDNIKLHEQGWKQRYYNDPPKKTNIEENGGILRMYTTYVEGLCWVLKYYYEGCPSWSWYYPFHYAPFASDLTCIYEYNIHFTLSEPFQPIQQLLSVLPSESAHALPESFRWLMTDLSSPIIGTYMVYILYRYMCIQLLYILCIRMCVCYVLLFMLYIHCIILDICIHNLPHILYCIHI